jgi:DNA-binding transcriptional ArsR family regulator
MASPHRISELASLLADSSRAAMLAALLDGSARPASELAALAGISPPTASGHLALLARADLLKVEPRGRHRYYRLAGPAVAEALESLSRLLPLHRDSLAHPERAALAEARLCYDHLAGRLGVAVTDALVRARWLRSAVENFQPTAAGERGLQRMGVVVEELRALRRPLVRACLDWTERREHVAGALGAAIASEALERGWVARRRGVRSLRLTPEGRQSLSRILGLRFD